MSSTQYLISDALWAKIEPLLPIHKTNHPLGTHRKRVDNRDAMNGILFVLRTGCQWNALNATGICTSSSAHRRFQEWRDAGVFERFWQNGLIYEGIDWRSISMDGCQTKAPLAGKKTGKNPTDRAKQGVKRSLLTDANGLPLAVVSDGANVHDIKLVLQTLDALECYRPPLQVPLYLDKGYIGQWLHDELVALNYIPHVQSRAEEVASLKQSDDFKAHRWVVERTHSWLNRYRRLLVRWEKKIENYEAMLHFACGLIVWNKSLLG
ncbi:IS5 family transposase [Photobacterium leiognathi]|uniref:IS5 family transposase n=1 Tax=Photobacterium leiognathi TaxID=553611 RepID=UPI00273818DE|nr:IS5 family transposase [Photobacterium leiognathi]